LKTLAITLIVLLALLFAVAWAPVIQARNAWRAGENAEAIAIADRWSQLRLWPGDYQQILAAAFLTAGNDSAAQPHLAAIGNVWIPAIDKTEVARQLFARGRYADFLAYDAASRERKDSDEVRLYRAAAQTVTNHVDAASATLSSINAANVERQKYDELRSTIDERKRGVTPPLIFDRMGGVLDSDPNYGPIVSAISARVDHNNTVDTTLDPFVQKAALAALGKYRGALVAIDPETNEILAIANSGGSENRAFDREYEPGSVIKVLTGLNAFASNADVNSMFPYECKGSLPIDGRHFGDWVPSGHGKLNSFDEALAVSCNVFFADLGLRLGRERLERFMQTAGFGGQANLGIFQVPLGRITGQVFNNFETAFLAIGLQHEQINTIHLAMLASMMAHRGVLTTPRLVRQRRSILGDVVGQPLPQGKTQLANASAAERIISAMQAVASEPRGTGRRAPVEGVTVAMKTGTAGVRQEGLDALIMAFAPVDKPKIAFGVIAEGAGPAEFAGAKITHDFLEQMKPRLQ
jgi:peptidoglycan glycosyltransferase